MKNRNKLFTSIAVLGSAIFAMVLTAGTGVFEALGLFNNTRTGSSTSTTNLILNKDNAYSSGTSQTINTTFGKNPIVFDYSGCSAALTNTHVYMPQNATVGNYYKANNSSSGINWNNKLTSIESIKPVFNAESGASLQFRASYDGKTSGGTWGEFAPLTSNTAFTLASNPYYIELKAVGGPVSLTSCEICFSCIENTSATGTPVYETKATVNDGTKKTYSVDDSFDNLIGGSTKNRSVTISDSFEVVETLSNGTTRKLNKGEFNYKVNNPSGTQIDTSKAFGTTGTYTAFIKVGSLAEVAYEFSVEERLVEEIVIPATKSMNTGTSGSISVTSISPSNAHNKTIRWSSSDTSVATIDSSTGAISALKAGKTTIKATATDVGGIASNGCTLTVTDISVTSVSLDKDSLLLYTDDNDVTLTPTILPEDATVKTVNWFSNNTSVVTVENGVVHPVGVGTAVITATSGSASDTCSVEVKSADARPKYFTFDFYNEDKIGSTNGSVLDVEDARDMMTCSDSTITNKSTVLVSYSNHSSTVQYDKNGGLTFGTTSNNGYATFTFGTSYLITKIEIIGVKYDDNATFTISDSYGENAVEGTGKLNARSSKLNECEYSLVWDNLSGTNAFCIKSSGCRATIYTMVVYYGAPEPKPLTNIAVSLSTNSIKINGTAQATATLTPTNPDNPEYTWSASSDPTGVVDISNTGLITGLKEGTATIKATSNSDSSIYGTASITVSKEAVTNVTVSPSTASIVPGGYQDLTATVSPSTATYKSVTWSGGGNGISVNTTGRVSVDSNATIGATATITATSDDNPNAKGTCTVTVKSNIVTPTSLILSNSTLTLSPGGNSTLTATVGPTGASQDVTWSSNNSLVTVSSGGVVTASNSVASTTTAIITCTATGYSSVYATCTVTVKVSGGTGGHSGLITDSLNIGDSVAIFCNNAGTELTSFSTYGVGTAFTGDPTGSLPFEVVSGNSSNTFAFKTNNGKYVNWTSGNSLDLSESLTDNSSWSVSIDASGNATVLNAEDNSRQILWNKGSPRFAAYSGKSVGNDYYAIQFYGLAPATPVPATTVDLDKTYLELAPGSSSQLTPIYNAGANTDKEVEWSTSNSNVATVSNGLVQVKNTASIGSTATIECKLLSTGDTATCSIKVVEDEKDAWTIMIYLCGSTLEYDSDAKTKKKGYATSDLKQMLDADLSDDVNVIIETGGVDGEWSLGSSYFDSSLPTAQRKISNTNLQRWEIKNKKLSLISTLETNEMSKQTEVQSFLEWGIKEYPADNTGVIFWDHGGGISGVCSDENYLESYEYNGETYYYANSLNCEEIARATEKAFDNTNTDKLTWIGYDACLMGVADLATVNADYFDYMVASQESEPGSGWDYKTFFNTLVSKKANSKANIEYILNNVCESFISENCTNADCGYTYSDGLYRCFSTLAVYDLSKAANLISAFNTYASSLNISNRSGYNKIKTAYTNCYSYGEDEYGSLYGNGDFIDFLNEMDKQFTNISSTNVRNAINEIVISNHYCHYYDDYLNMKPCGICVFVPEALRNEDYGLQCEKTDYEGSYATKFSSWQLIVRTYGGW